MKDERKKPSIGVCSFALSAGPEVQILPDGTFRTDDGRPHGLAGWRLNPEIAATVLSRARARRRDTVIDYEHQTVTGQQAPAAGWFHDLNYRDGEGLFIADARWTTKAKNHIEQNEYRYVSAVFTYDPDTGAVLRILHVAITNDPAIDGMAELEVAAAAKFLSTPTEDNTTMNEQLLKLLGLDKTATDDEALAALKTIITDRDNLKTATKKHDAKIAELKSKLETTETNDPDPEKYVSADVAEKLKTEVVELKNDLNKKEVDGLVGQAMTDGKLLPAQEQWARELGAKDIAALKAYIDSAAPIAALKGKQTEETPVDNGGDIVPSEVDQAVCRQLGVNIDEFKEARVAELQSGKD